MIDEAGEMLGIMPTAQALEMAREKELDLIEVSPKANPPVVKILSFDKYRYQLGKAESQQRKKQKKVEVKGIRISVRIGQHDLEFKAKNAGKFLQKGNKVKVEMFLKGRERANLGFAFEVFDKFFQTISEAYEMEQRPKKEGYRITSVIGPK